MRRHVIVVDAETLPQLDDPMRYPVGVQPAFDTYKETEAWQWAKAHCRQPWDRVWDLFWKQRGKVVHLGYVQWDDYLREPVSYREDLLGTTGIPY